MGVSFLKLIRRCLHCLPGFGAYLVALGAFGGLVLVSFGAGVYLQFVIGYGFGSVESLYWVGFGCLLLFVFLVVGLADWFKLLNN